MITYTWKVTDMLANTQGGNPDFVVQTRWSKTGTDSDTGLSGTFSGATPFKYDPSSAVIPYDQLTEAIVLGWIQDTINANPGYAAHIDAQIAKQLNPNKAEEVPLPWAPPTPPTPTSVPPAV
jgi:hypothetical protein